MTDEPERYALLKIQTHDGQPSLAESAEILGIDQGLLDRDFGVVAVDMDTGEFVVRTLLGNVPKDLPQDSGPFSDPQIETFGPPQ